MRRTVYEELDLQDTKKLLNMTRGDAWWEIFEQRKINEVTKADFNALLNHYGELLNYMIRPWWYRLTHKVPKCTIALAQYKTNTRFENKEEVSGHEYMIDNI